MGCDIHLHTEVKIKGVWEHYCSCNLDRDHDLFTLMAGVRDRGVGIKPISKPRGVPADATVITKYDAKVVWGSDGHSHSFLHASELEQIEKFMLTQRNENFPERQWGYLFGNSWGGFTEYPEDRPKGLEDVRFIFWFDN